MFLTLTEVPDGKASGIFNTIKNIFEQKNISFKNMVGFTADNCPVMMGKTNGVQAKLKEVVPSLIVNGCVCHNLNLSSKAAAEQFPDVVDKLIKEINHHFCNSSSRRLEFQEFQEHFGTNLHTILKYCATRWLSRQVLERMHFKIALMLIFLC